MGDRRSRPSRSARGSARPSPGALQSTLGNLPELFIVLFALSAGELVVAQFSILGSLFANALLVLGLAIVAGSTRQPDGTMSFGARLPNDTATLLLLAVFLISILGLSDQVGDSASHHQVEISVVGAICLLVVYGAWLVGYLRSDRTSEAALVEPKHGALPFQLAIVLLAVVGRRGRVRLRLVRRTRSTRRSRRSASRRRSPGS